MGKFQKRPVVIEAIQYDGHHTGALHDFCGDSFCEPVDGKPYIKTLEGNMEVAPGDYVIKGVQGEFYPCKPDIFKATYTAAEPANFKELEYKVFPSEETTVRVVDDPVYGGAHTYQIRHSTGFSDGRASYVDESTTIQFIQKNDDGSMVPGVQSEQLAYVLLDRAVKLNNRFPSPQNEKQIAGLRMFLEGCEDRVRDRMDRGVMGELKK